MATPVAYSPDGRSVRVMVGDLSLSPVEARDFARALLEEASYADGLRDIHERHVDLRASCALCRYEAGSQIDRLIQDKEDDDD